MAQTNFRAGNRCCRRSRQDSDPEHECLALVIRPKDRFRLALHPSYRGWGKWKPGDPDHPQGDERSHR